MAITATEEDCGLKALCHSVLIRASCDVRDREAHTIVYGAREGLARESEMACVAPFAKMCMIKTKNARKTNNCSAQFDVA